MTIQRMDTQPVRIKEKLKADRTEEGVMSPNVGENVPEPLALMRAVRAAPDLLTLQVCPGYSAAPHVSIQHCRAARE